MHGETGKACPAAGAKPTLPIIRESGANVNPQRSLVAKRYAHAARGLDGLIVLRDKLGLARNLGERIVADRAADHRDSLTILLSRDELRGVNAETILEAADVYALFRTLQVLGAYGFRGLVQKRAHFIESIPGALANLFDLISRGVANSFPELKRVCLDMCADPRFAANADDGLNIKVFSFSYKRGYPDDFSGNGGGFMFDCRGMHNPGRYEEYRHLTGRDRQVIEFLRERGEADAFASKAFDMVSPVVERYLQRGFSSLQVGFGCTGGQHRSVYCAENVARKLADTFPGARVQLIHREQNITEDL